jgi:hypothetical protein
VAIPTAIARTRSAPRVKLASKLVVDGKDLLGNPFTEDAEAHDISQTGISFYLSKNRPWVEDSLEITIYPTDNGSSAFFFGRKAKGKVVRTEPVSGEKQLIAARFES